MPIEINQNIYIRNPLETKLGLKIIEHSINLIDKIGFEQFTFKKLATQINSTEASIYRYFENKHKLLLYLVSWYWEWVSFKIEMGTINIDDTKKKIQLLINVLVNLDKDDIKTTYINEKKLGKIVIEEGLKAYHLKNIDEENKKGVFMNMKSLNQKIASIILDINPQYKYSNSLASILIDTALNHIYYSNHLPRLVNITSENTIDLQLFLETIISKQLDVDFNA